MALAMTFDSGLVFETPKHQQEWLGGYFRVLKNLPHEVYESRRQSISKAVGAPTEVVPEVISQAVLAAISRVACQRAQAAREFCKDVYANREPRIFKEHPSLEAVVRSNRHFFPELVETPFARNAAWDFVMALDWLFEVNDGQAHMRVLECDTGGVAGVLRIACMYEHLKGVLPVKQLHSRVLDGSSYLDALIRRFRSAAHESEDSVNVLFSEDDIKEMLEGTPASYLARLLQEHGIQCVSSWNRTELSCSLDGRNYVFKGCPVGGIWLRYYSSALDPVFRGFHHVKGIYELPGYRRHSVPGFWEKHINSEGKDCYINNPIGCELFCDKATSSYIGTMIRFYLAEEPAGPDAACLHFADADKDETYKKIDEVFQDKDGWVVKQRTTAGHGNGVVIGASATDDSWRRLRANVERTPFKFIAQPRYSPSNFSELGGISKRYAEFRMLTYAIKGEVHVIPGILARTSLGPDELRNMTGNPENSLVPILISREEAVPSAVHSQAPRETSDDWTREILVRLCQGYYPNFDKKALVFKWDRNEDVRYVIRPSAAVLARAEEMLAKTSKGLEIREDADFSLVLNCLMDRVILADSWVTSEVAAVYQALHASGHVHTVEAYKGGRLVGGVLGIKLGRAFLAETMFKIADDASKACLAHLARRLCKEGYEVIDVQVEHRRDHPARRLGEELVSLSDYLNILQRAAKDASTYE